jgi:hypothetical protein
MKSPRILMRSVLVAVIACSSADTASAGSVTGLPLGPAFGPDPQLALTDGIVSNDGTDLDITLNFSTPISPPAAFVANSVFGYVFLDTDQDQQTGSSLSQLDSALGLGLNSIPAGQIPTRLGVDYVVELDSVGGLVPGQVDVLSATSLFALGSVPITYEPESLSLSIPLTLLTDPAAIDPFVSFGAIIGNPNGPTDTLQSVPEPTSFILAGLAVACAGCYRWAVVSRRTGCCRSCSSRASRTSTARSQVRWARLWAAAAWPLARPSAG